MPRTFLAILERLGEFFRRTSVQRVLVLVAGCLGIAFAGTIFAFSSFQLALKQRYSFSQSTVENIASLGNMGIAFGVLPGYLTDKYGGKLTLFIAIILQSGAYVVLWSAAPLVSFYNREAWLLHLYFFFVGLGGSFTYFSILTINVGNFPRRHHGKVIGLLDAFLSAGKAVCAGIYGGLFVNGHINGDERKQDLAGYFITIAVLVAVVNTICLLTQKRFPPEPEVDRGEADDSIELVTQNSEPSESTSLTQVKPHISEDDQTILVLFKDWDFWYMLLIVTFGTSVQLTIIANYTLFLQSFGHEELNVAFTVASPLVGCFAKAFSGLLSDFVIKELPREYFVLITAAAQTIILVLFIFYGDSVLMMIFLVIGINIPNGALWSLAPVITVEIFGLKHLGRNWGFFQAGSCIGVVVLQRIYGALYDYYGYIDATTGETKCFGRKCFMLSTTVSAVLSACSVLLLIGLLERKYNALRKR
ncbi:uncharacterized protein LOC106178396 [Lingula anatina]|uniref:Uncharacterized protein LOC106178396 n=1 Tax=Lingula anatina TaxID=7574 RepID=A0A1S3K423_LINAN|nr:uncharacterized protein LOC106178396 [Lingula anatina]|eukprot:XP_013417006.1 uncharacterized protein LOC106178396 [Lingula anatina]